MLIRISIRYNAKKWTKVQFCSYIIVKKQIHNQLKEILHCINIKYALCCGNAIHSDWLPWQKHDITMNETFVWICDDNEKQESDDMIRRHLQNKYYSSMKDVVSKQLVQRHTVQYDWKERHYI